MSTMSSALSAALRGTKVPALTAVAAKLPPHECVAVLCSNMVVPGEGCVPDLPTLYEQLRAHRDNGCVNEDEPLTPSEIFSLEMCKEDAKDVRWAVHGITMHRTAKTLEIMQAWARNNARNLRQEHRQEELAKQQIRQAERHAPRVFDFVARTFAGQKPREEKPAKQYRSHTKKIKRHRDPNAPKNYGDQKERFAPASAPEKSKKNKKKKGKSGGDQDGGKKNGKKK
jgi:hypothetical protein